MTDDVTPARLSGRDLFRVAAAGLRSRPLRVVLSALGIAVGIGAMVAVLGIAASSRAQLDATLSRLGTNLLTVAPGKTLSGENAKLPLTALGMTARVGPVQMVSATSRVSDARVYRTDQIDPDRSGGITVLAAHDDLPRTVGTSVVDGVWLNQATASYPTTVLGREAARSLGVGRAGPDARVWLGGHWFTVIGILDAAPLATELDNSALVGWPVARRLLGSDGHATTLYVRATDDSVAAVREVLPRTVNPANPEQVTVSRPSDALLARVAATATFTGLLLGVGAVALLVGGIGVANTMVISVLERRGEIGLRRALGATRGHISIQFLGEALLLSALGGVAGLLVGVAGTAGYAATRGWPVAIPGYVPLGGLATTVVIGTLAGLYPALRAARLSPTEALLAN
ncbi:ABC transporter permease [Plantactinospora sp. GCM10030261]|uniref:ABC transporter permease n=1 Tax=Plantactinospora sp. GCM10030261 TaxID=3273420 RepID=UPI003610F696